MKAWIARDNNLDPYIYFGKKPKWIDDSDCLSFWQPAGTYDGYDNCLGLDPELYPEIKSSEIREYKLREVKR